MARYGGTGRKPVVRFTRRDSSTIVYNRLGNWSEEEEEEETVRACAPERLPFATAKRLTVIPPRSASRKMLMRILVADR